METDIELIKRSLRRDQSAFAELFDRHGRAVFRYAYGLTHDVADADDLVQDTFLAAWRKLAETRLVGESLLPWLIVTCRNNASNLRRSKAVRAHAPLEEADGSTGEDSTLDRVQHIEELSWVFKAVNELNATDRRIVELCLYEGRDYHEAAALLGLSVGVLTKRIHRTRTRLREQRSFHEREASA